MAVVGVYLLFNQVQVTTSFWSFGRYGGFGPTLLPLLVGVAFLFYNGRSIIGWMLTTLFNTIVMLALLFGGLGLIARSLRGVGDSSAAKMR